MDTKDLILNFAKTLKDDERVINFAQARAYNDKDEELQALIGEFELARVRFVQERNKADKDEAKLKEHETNMNTLYEQIMQMDSMVEYNEAKKEIDSLVKYLNMCVQTAIQGGDPETVSIETDCGGDCGGCTKCG